jgi:hypothetical protein
MRMSSEVEMEKCFNSVFIPPRAERRGRYESKQQCNAMQCNAMQCNAMQCNESESQGRSGEKWGGDARIVGCGASLRFSGRCECGEVGQSRAQRNVNC